MRNPWYALVLWGGSPDLLKRWMMRSPPLGGAGGWARAIWRGLLYAAFVTWWRRVGVVLCVCESVFVCVELRRGVLGFIPEAVPIRYTARASSPRFRHDTW